MDQHSVQVIIETLKEEGVDLAVTLPEEPTFSLTEAMRQDPFFQAVTVAGEGNGLAFCAGAALGGRRVVFVTGIAGLLVGTWALSQMGMVYGAPILILASYRGDFGDHSGIPGLQPSYRSFVERRGALVKRFDCLKFLTSLVDEHMLAVTSLSTNAPFWFN